MILEGGIVWVGFVNICSCVVVCGLLVFGRSWYFIIFDFIDFLIIFEKVIVLVFKTYL